MDEEAETQRSAMITRQGVARPGLQTSLPDSRAFTLSLQQLWTISYSTCFSVEMFASSPNSYVEIHVMSNVMVIEGEASGQGWGQEDGIL